MAASFALIGVPAFAQPVDLEIAHHIVTVGEDGVKRTVEFRERMFRRADQIWVERVMPGAKHEGDVHGDTGQVHKHLDAAIVPRWLARDREGAVTFRLVDARDRATYVLTPADYPNVGFNGAWDAAYFLFDPGSLAAMTQGTAQAGARWYVKKAPDSVLRILWDESLRYPRTVEYRRLDGRESRRTTVTRVASPMPEPWAVASAFDPRDYTDLLD